MKFLVRIARSFLILGLLCQLFISSAVPVSAQTPSNITCGWEARHTPGFADTLPFFCMHGFSSPAELTQYTVGASCLGCLTPLRQAAERIFGVTEQKIPLSSLPSDFITQEGDTWGTCVGGFLDTDVIHAVVYTNNFAADYGSKACYVTAGAGAAAAGVGGVTIWAIPLIVTGGAVCAAAAKSLSGDIANASAPINLVLRSPNGSTVCEQSFSYTYKVVDELTDNETTGPFDLCKQAGAPGSATQTECRACAGKDGIWTGVGCIPYTEPAFLVRALITIGLGIAGTVVVLMTLAGGFLMTTSQGDPKRVDEAKSLITSAIAGIFFLIFSVSILQFIGVTVLHIPGFG